MEYPCICFCNELELAEHFWRMWMLVLLRISVDINVVCPMWILYVLFGDLQNREVLYFKIGGKFLCRWIFLLYKSLQPLASGKPQSHPWFSSCSCWQQRLSLSFLSLCPISHPSWVVCTAPTAKKIYQAAPLAVGPGSCGMAAQDHSLPGHAARRGAGEWACGGSLERTIKTMELHVGPVITHPNPTLFKWTVRFEWYLLVSVPRGTFSKMMKMRT